MADDRLRRIEADIQRDILLGKIDLARQKWGWEHDAGRPISTFEELEAAAQGQRGLSADAAVAAQQRRQQIAMMPQIKNPGVAAVLSFLFAGLGQIYNGQILKALIFMVCYGISIVAIAAGIGLLTTPILWLWGMIDAYKTAERINRDAARAAFG